MNWLGRSSSMVANRCTAQDTFTHDLAVEVYMRESPLMRFVRGKNNINVQLVVRIARTWDGGCGVPGVSDQFKPFLKSIVPSGITLAEIAGELKRASPGLVTAATSNKTLLNVVLARVSSQSPVEVDHGQNNYGLHSFPHTRDNGLSVCEYDSELPPLYSE
ncbi:hypothetical protein LPJ66_006357 [Kickxella alabastrina]|uniref:Uncharacterized protein n=1 Tax=Kickxella alabastrina TaxID=61397 RepID=A0ACC1IDD0_9FUNG|nr:hypothetical protein LPJ66_006357 [Kickxella alabastrina]